MPHPSDLYLIENRDDVVIGIASPEHHAEYGGDFVIEIPLWISHKEFAVEKTEHALVIFASIKDGENLIKGLEDAIKTVKQRKGIK